MPVERPETLKSINIRHHGAVSGVTGSCHQLMLPDGSSLLIDCGLFQGRDVSPRGEADNDNPVIDFDFKGVIGLVCTHVHTDHIARLPYLVAAGFDGPIYCSFPSAMLLPDVLRESIKFSGIRNRSDIDAIVSKIEKQLTPLSYDAWAPVTPQMSIRLQPAGHILGSAYVECSVLGKGRVVFSGDLGCDDAVLLKSPKSPSKADVLVIEATYGHRNHEGRADRRKRLEECIDHALQDLGTVLIPAFSLGRTQELLYEIELILSERMKRERGRGMWAELVVVVDSPLASKFTQTYRRLKPYWDREAQKRLKLGHSPLNFAQMLMVDDHASHHRVVQHLKRTARPAIVISASGMCQGGRIMDYLKVLLPDKRTDVLFVGYQASDSLGRAIQEGAERVYIDDEPVDVLASVYTISGYSAHADQQGLRDFVKGIPIPPQEVRIVHGEDKAKRGLQKALSEDLPEAFVWIPEG